MDMRLTIPTTFAALVGFALAASVSCRDDLTPTTVRMAVLPGSHAAHAVLPGSDHGGAPFATLLTQEVTATPVFAGDPDGVGDALVTVNLGQREVCWQVQVSSIALPATASHIHRADPGVRGPIVLPLSAPDAAGSSTGCAGNLDRDLLQEILTSPASFYVNVHTTEFPAGAVRGQLPR